MGCIHLLGPYTMRTVHMCLLPLRGSDGQQKRAGSLAFVSIASAIMHTGSVMSAATATPTTRGANRRGNQRG